ncbi:MAG: hypothetical protein ACRCYV_09550 [Aeromonas sp.]
MQAIRYARGLGWAGSLLLTACASPFETLWQGLPTCELPALYLDAQTQQPAHPLLARYMPYKVADGFAWYRVHESWHGLPVSGFLLPTSTFEVHALFIDAPLANARQQVLAVYGQAFADEGLHLEGRAPLLMRDPDNSKRSILDCTRGDSAATEIDKAQDEQEELTPQE